MLSRTILNALAIFASAATASPTSWSTSSGDALVQYLEERAAPALNFKFSSHGSIVTPDSPQWENDTSRWSTWSAPSYSVAFFPGEERDVSVALKYMSSHNISWLAMGGGHGNTLTLATAQNVVLINMERINKITMNPDKSVSVGGGALFGDLYPVVYAAGRELPLGACACVGVGGASLGGGHSRLQGKYGLIVDAITKMRVVLWDGSVLDVSETKNSDLFWAMRGAGHNFGIVLEFTYKTWPLQNGGLTYNADMTFTSDSLAGVLGVINDLIPTLDAGLALDMFIYYDPPTQEIVSFLNIVYAGTLEQGNKFTDLFATKNASGTHIERLTLNVTMIPWERIPHEAANGIIDLACTEGFEYNTFTVNMGKFDIPQQLELYDSYVDLVTNNPLASSSLIFYEVFGQQAVVAQDPAKTAAGNRDYSAILAVLQTTYTDESVAGVADAWGRRWRDDIFKPEHSGYPVESVYMNYAHGDEPLQAMYGWEPWRLERLRSLKKRYDPHGFFNFYNSVL